MTTPGHWHGADLVWEIRVQPRASRTRILGLHGGAIKIALTAPPVEGAANEALCQWLADELRVAKGRVSIVSGGHARTKRVCIQAADATCVRAFCQRWQLPEPVAAP
ncbi:MAG: DUF167 domain-containing protein [Magnetococcales bacterium]|nr:DUF167 domain-containing protein [Magnetococcales bacterium]